MKRGSEEVRGLRTARVRARATGRKETREGKGKGGNIGKGEEKGMWEENKKMGTIK